MFRKLWEKIKRLWQLAKSERASPREIGWAVAIGAFAGCTPAVGFHGWLGIGLATLFRKNRLFAWLGTRISNMIFLPFITIAEVQVSHRLRTGEWVVLDREHAVDQAGSLLLDWCLGTIPVGIAIAGVMGFASYGIARNRDRRRAAKKITEAESETEGARGSGAQPQAEKPKEEAAAPARRRGGVGGEAPDDEKSVGGEAPDDDQSD